MTEATPLVTRADQACLSRPETAAGRLQRLVLQLLREHQDEAMLPTNLRFLFYEGSQRGWWSKDDRRNRSGAVMRRNISQDLSVASMHLREVGLVPWPWVEDETRDLTAYAYAPTVEDFLLDRVAALRLSPWGATDPPLVLTESRSLSGVLERVAGRFVAPIAAVGGQASGGLIATRIAPYLREHPESEVIYLGDLDLSGADIEASLRSRIEQRAGVSIGTWHRLLLTEAHVPEVRAAGRSPIAKADKRYRPAREYLAWEAEALGQARIVRLLTEALEERCEVHPDGLLDREAEAREHWTDLLTDPAYAYTPSDGGTS